MFIIPYTGLAFLLVLGCLYIVFNHSHQDLLLPKAFPDVNQHNSTKLAII